jgi:hypothetical protein
MAFDIVIPSEILLKSSDDVRRHDRHWCCIQLATIRNVYDEEDEVVYDILKVRSTDYMVRKRGPGFTIHSRQHTAMGKTAPSGLGGNYNQA